MSILMQTALREAIEPAYRLLPARYNSPERTVLLLAFGAQESRFEHTDQIDKAGTDVLGPALGWWQFERGGGVVGVLSHRSTAKLAQALCVARDVLAAPRDAWRALKDDQVFAAGMAALLIYTDPEPLPRIGDVDGAFSLYLRTWRPGAWTNGTPAKRQALRNKFSRNYDDALRVTRGLA